ncbi:hypothetical protein F53441_9448 [Fusarium austroafricanum]|uniref:Thioredoxin domain-containing protein n=1 Tax=Fusarium austroafricanum TaxID=2364996 RepID=A0A8H4K936_9HYPO|nr:hypothetical protein F53441_9448 [Fusarium austroafricanum]
MKFAYTALLAFSVTAVNACDKALYHAISTSVPTAHTLQYICGKDKTKCDEICADSPDKSPPNSDKMVHNIRTKDEFYDALSKYPVVVVDFYSTHSAESKHIAATFAHAYELDKFKDFRFVKVDIDDLKGLAEELGVSQPASFQMYKNGEKVNDLHSDQTEDLMMFLETGL